MKVKVKETQEIIDVEFAYDYNSGGQIEKIWQDSFSGKLYRASLLEQIKEEKTVSLNKACDILYAMLCTQDINDYYYVTAPAYEDVVDFVDDFRKAMEK